MEPDDELCLCFHVTRRKVGNFIRVEKPIRASQISDCGGAGTGCGWCRPFLQKMFEDGVNACEWTLKLPTPQEYSQKRQNYLDQKKRNRNLDSD
ncbi:MAG: (2Fe-2S)-binding protein [Planctomycetota bacterium]|nr:(2Fe-2S)-binding protein [Planctomycetota bacterium]